VVVAVAVDDPAPVLLHHQVEPEAAEQAEPEQLNPQPALQTLVVVVVEQAINPQVVLQPEQQADQA
jgi:hypothetical protein